MSVCMYRDLFAAGVYVAVRARSGAVGGDGFTLLQAVVSCEGIVESTVVGQLLFVWYDEWSWSDGVGCKYS